MALLTGSLKEFKTSNREERKEGDIEFIEA